MGTAIERIVDAALEGHAPDVDELTLLCALDPFSRDAYYLRWGAHELQRRASGGRGEVFSQIGIDAYPCDGGCTFCSFSTANNSWEGDLEVDVETVLGYARRLAAKGLHMLSLMTTNSYDFGRFCDLAACVREAVGPELSLMANIDDFDGEQAERLAEAGINSVYNAARLGEGVITGIPIERRFETLDAACEAGLSICSGIEPLRPGLDPRDIAERIVQVVAYDPVLFASCSLVPVAGTKWEGCCTTLRPWREMVNCACRLAGTDRVPHVYSSTSWVTLGTRPRGIKAVLPDELDGMFEAERARVEDEGWEVVPGERTPRWFTDAWRKRHCMR